MGLLFLCMLAYYVEWHVHQKLASYLYENEDNNSIVTDIEFIEDTIEYNAIYSHEGYEIEITKFEVEASNVEGIFQELALIWVLLTSKILL